MVNWVLVAFVSDGFVMNRVAFVSDSSVFGVVAVIRSISSFVVVGSDWGVIVGNNFSVLVVDRVYNGDLFNYGSLSLVVVMLVVVGVRLSNLLGVSMVVTTLGDNVVLLGSGDSEVLRLVLLVIVVIGIVLVTVSVLRGHVVVSGVHIVVRANLVG